MSGEIAGVAVSSEIDDRRVIGIRPASFALILNGLTDAECNGVLGDLAANFGSRRCARN
ncbi:MAG: hypothetical protein ACKVIY_02595 [Acidimicrobiales bacterium]